MVELCDVMERLGHFDGIVPSPVRILTNWHGVCGGKYLLKTPENTISKTKFQNVPRYLNLQEITYAFGKSSKAAYYSLSAYYLKMSWKPWVMLARKHKWTNNGFSNEEFILFLYHTQKNKGGKKTILLM